MCFGSGDILVGRSHECDNPEWVKSLPVCTKAPFDVSVSSGAIDAKVRRRLKAGEPLYHVNTDLIRELKPDLLITQAHGEVCAVTPGDVEHLHLRVDGVDPPDAAGPQMNRADPAAANGLGRISNFITNVLGRERGFG